MAGVRDGINYGVVFGTRLFDGKEDNILFVIT